MLININPKILIFYSIFIFSSSLAVANQAHLTKEIKNIKNSFQSLNDDIRNIDKWDNYLAFFPATYSKFKQIFDPDDFSRLYGSSYEYIILLNDAPESMEVKTRKIILSIGKGGAKGCCDSWSALHKVATKLLIKDTKVFAVLIKSLNPHERTQFIKFIADKENHRSFWKYQIIIDNLNDLKENDLAKKFEAARKSRKKEKH